MLWDSLLGDSTELLSCFSVEELAAYPGIDQWTSTAWLNVRLGKHLRVVRSKAKDLFPIWPTSHSEMREVRYTPPDIVLALTFIIYGNSVALLSSVGLRSSNRQRRVRQPDALHVHRYMADERTHADGGHLPQTSLFRKQHPMISATKLRNLLGLGAALGIWQLTVSAGWVSRFMMPSPMDVVKAIGALAADGSLREHLSESLLRVGMGYLIAAAIGLPIGFCAACGSLPLVIRPVIEALRPIPPLAWVPIAILWFSLGDASAYFLVFLGCFFPMFFGAYTAVRSMDQNLINAARCLGASRWMLLRDVFVPASLPIVMPNLRLALGLGLDIDDGDGGVDCSSKRLEHLIQQSRQVFQIQNVVAGMATIRSGGLRDASLERWSATSTLGLPPSAETRTESHHFHQEFKPCPTTTIESPNLSKRFTKSARGDVCA